MRRLSRSSLLFVAASGFNFSPVVAADLNVAVASRVISFREPRPAGQIGAAIVFDPANAASVAEAAAIERAVGGGLAVGGATLRVSRVSVRQLGALSGARVAFVTGGLADRYNDLAAAAQRGSVLTITSDLACVRSGHCAVGLSSGAKVQITVNRAACKAAGIKFGSAFLMLVKEI